jgi:uncharacterized phage-associated protein
MLNSFEAAKVMCQLSEWKITNLELQKLLYISHLVLLGAYGKKLVNENFQAWNLGPVLPSVYHWLKVFGISPIRDMFGKYNTSKDSAEFKIMEEVYDALREMKAYDLIGLTHKEKGGWAKNFEPGLNALIPDNDIINEYKAYYEKK